MQIVWSSTWLHAAPLDFQEGGGDDFDGSVLWDLEMLDWLKCKSIFCKLMHRCQVYNKKWGESYCMLTCHFSHHFLWSSASSAHVVGCYVVWLATCVCLGYAAESSQRPHGSRRKVFLTPFGPVNSLELVRRSMARAFRMLEEEPWNLDGWATTRWFRADIHNIIILDKFSYVLRLKLKYIQYLFGVKVTGISYQHNRGWPVAAQCLYPGGGWCHGFAMAWLAAPRSVMDFPWKHVRTKWHNLAVTWRSSNAWLRYVSWEGMTSGYGDNSSQISVGTILYNHAKHA